MRSCITWAAVALAVEFGAERAAAGEKTRDYPSLGTIERHKDAFDKLIPADARIEKLASGFKWSEGPVWIKDGGFLLFSDIPNNVINKWQEGKGVTKFIHPAGYTGTKIVPAPR